MWKTHSSKFSQPIPHTLGDCILSDYKCHRDVDCHNTTPLNHIFVDDTHNGDWWIGVMLDMGNDPMCFYLNPKLENGKDNKELTLDWYNLGYWDTKEEAIDFIQNNYFRSVQ